MAGVVAMASVIEDFETQPCKRSCKDAHAPPVKMITNYFSPVPKPMEKPFSPPRSNNIMDYFSRKTTPVREKGSTPEQTKENRLGPQPSESPASLDSPVRLPAKPRQKQGRKPSKVARQLQETDADVGSTETEECVVLEGPGDEGNVVSSSCGFLGSDTAALLAQFSADAGMAGDTCGKNDHGAACLEKAQKDNHPKVYSKKRAPLKKKESRDGSPKIPRKDKVTVSKAKAKQQEDKETEEYVPEVQEAELSLCDASLEVNVGEASQLNGSTVTISFEDFLQTQGQGEEKVGEKSRVDPEPEDTLDVPKAKELCPLQISPRTLTIQAEVHTISPGHEPVLVAEKKIASIFSREKEGSLAPVVVKTASFPHPQSRLELLPAPKRRSNVVLQEEDLELSVVESESSTPKCSQTERKQFMSAFKQPAKPGKGPGKQPVDKALGEAVEEENHSAAPTEEQPGKNAAKKKPQRRGRKKALEQESVPSPTAQEDHVPMETDAVETDSKPKGESNTEAKPGAEPTPSTPTTVRRSTREAPCRQTPVVDPVTPVRKTKKERVKDVAAVTVDCPVQMSTPKSDKSRHRLFRAQMVCPPDKTGSPIRMKFTRVVFRSSASKSEGGSDFEILSPLATKESNASKKRKKAKKLVKKAREIQQSKKASADKEGQRSFRRSTRSQGKKSYIEDENSVVWVEDSQDGSALTAKEKGTAQKRSLNDVLGKKAPASKGANNPAVAPMFLGKKAQRTSVISIFDDRSCDASENSQDDEQFRARREFLKSGLPESFKKQIAKTVATNEAYAVSCSSFQPVVHVLQASQECPLWSLPWPVSPRLHFLKELRCLPSNQLTSLDSSTCCKTEPASRAHTERGSGWREDFSEPIRKLLMEEISASNPPFPVQRFLTRFLKRRADHLQECTASEADPSTKLASSAPASTEPVGRKRKRVEEGEGAVGKVAKKQMSRRSEKKIIVIDGGTISPEPEPPRRGGRGRRRKQQENEEMKTPLPYQKDPVGLLEDSPLASNSVKDDSVKEDMLWTEKYQPQHSNDVIGNTASVRRLHSWLREWKLRADREERKKQKEKKQEEKKQDDDSNDSWDTKDGDSQEGEDFMCNTLLITGPTGVGKTAAVYACAQELGFKVFEVNASSQRSGRQILSQLREATQSHQVDIQGVNTHKPCYFSSSTARPGSSPRKVYSPRRVVSSPRKSPRGATRGGLAPTSLANFFKTGRPGPTNKEPASASQDQKQPTAVPKKTSKAKESSSKTEEPQNRPAAAAAITKDSSSEEQSKKTATSLILFEEVDVVFDDDSGFLAAIKTFMTTTKRPVILTTSDPTFSTMFDGYFEEIHFKTPSVVKVGSYLQLLCLAENMRTDARDVSSLLHLNGCDIRQSLLHLQFWSRSTGGRKLSRPLPDSAPTVTQLQPKTEETAGGSVVSEGGTPAGPLPPCDTGCTESMLGLLNIEPEREMQDLFKSQSTVEPGCWELLTTSKRRGMDLLYSNMEALLPLPTTHLTVTTHRRPQEVSNRTQEESSADPQEVATSMNSIKPEIDPPLPLQTEVDPLPHARVQQVAEGSETDGSPVKVSSRMKKKKKQLGTRENLDPFHSDSDSDDAFLSLHTKPPPNPPQTQTEGEDSQDDSTSNKVELESVKAREEGVKEKAPPPVRMRVPLTPEQRMKSEPVSHCLGSLAEFLDHMSLLDSSLCRHTSPVGGARYTHRTFGLRVEIKDGMNDEPEEECHGGSWVEGERAGEIQAAVEALSFQRCRAGVEEAWGTAQGLEGELGKEAVNELTLPVAPHRRGFRLTQDSPCEPKVLQKRREVMDILPRQVAGTLGNRPAAALDFLPFLRTICRSETLKEQFKVKRRFLHYLDAIHLGLPKNTLQYLAEDFP
ncbi:ATPase family AAA domain-containing protein 5 [Oncorhynchus mykiss]|uniref:ATPase family AAA domain containing 5a n=1 Tax=Oncorhynchus mykiss TaxID=8022 RepID=A0A8C7T7R6_ONCMY|nr:ATPase family AAA domain-containing protein 5 [Oncorhynchus mykiss]XP_036794905.1 ATPase family AAA domain-containing protein 5 [Oncorhynchus mykiss]